MLRITKGWMMGFIARRPTLLLLLLAPALLSGLETRASGQAPRPSQEYRVGPKDVLKVTVWGHEDLSRQVVVSADGTFPFPLVGDIRAAGLTPGEIEGRLRDTLGKDYLVNPQVSVSVQEYRSQRVFVLGEVEKPGTYVLTGQTTLLDVLSQAGGPGKNAGRQVVVVRVPTSSGPVAPDAAGSVTLRANLKRLLDGIAGENVPLQSGDTVYVPKLTSFFVLGEVQRQGAYAMEKETTALEAVTLAGGFTDRAAPSGGKILRRRADGAQDSIDVDLTDPRAREVQLTEGDTLLVPRGNTFFVSGEVRKPGAYQLEKSTTAFGAVTVAGGFTEKAGQSQVKLIRRLPSGQEQTQALDLSGGDPAARDLVLKDGDTLLVPSGNTFYVLGEVKKPGAYQLDPATTAVSAMTLAGGFTDKAAQSQIKLTRRLPSGVEQTTMLDLSGADPRAREFLLKDGDILLVPTGNTFYVMGEVKRPGAYQLDPSTTAIQAIAMAGGFTDKAAPNRTKIIRTHPDGRQETIVVDLNEVVKRGRKEKDLSLIANDVLVVPETYF
jgi:polysaccharide export outer membrane protein